MADAIEPRQRGWRRCGAALAALLLAGCSAEQSADTRTPAPVPVTLVRVGDAAAAQTVATGIVRLRRETPLAFVSDGRIRALSVREGDVVAAGHSLASLDTAAIDASVASATADAARAASELERQRQLLKQGWVPKARVESAQAAASAASAALTAAKFNQRFAAIAAPASGVILARLAEPGQTLAAGTPVLVLGEFASGFVLRVPMAAGAVAGLQRGNTGTVTFRDLSAPPMTARIIELAGRADPQTGTFQVEFALPAHPALKSGLIADVRIPRAAGSGSIAIPATALFAARADEGFVWRYDPASRKVEARLVRLGAVSGKGVVVSSGLQRGDLIVASGVDRLIEGQTVAPVQPAPAA